MKRAPASTEIGFQRLPAPRSSSADADLSYLNSEDLWEPYGGSFWEEVEKNVRNFRNSLTDGEAGRDHVLPAEAPE